MSDTLNVTVTRVYQGKLGDQGGVIVEFTTDYQSIHGEVCQSTQRMEWSYLAHIATFGDEPMGSVCCEVLRQASAYHVKDTVPEVYIQEAARDHKGDMVVTVLTQGTQYRARWEDILTAASDANVVLPLRLFYERVVERAEPVVRQILDSEEHAVYVVLHTGVVPEFIVKEGGNLVFPHASPAVKLAQRIKEHTGCARVARITGGSLDESLSKAAKASISDDTLNIVFIA